MVAAGSGSRLGQPVPKALVELAGIALVRRAVDSLADGGVERAVVVVPAGMSEGFAAALAGAAIPVRIVVGGERRQDSVLLGIDALAEELADEAVVLVHDAARPLVPADVVRRVADAVAVGARAVIPVVAVVDSIREIAGSGSRLVDRSRLRAVQTPQGFPLGVLREAHRHLAERGLEVTDDAAAAEAIGCEVTLVSGHRDALKITEPADLAAAEAIVAGRLTR